MEILKSIYYKQNLSRARASQVEWVKNEISSMLHLGLLRRNNDNLILTELGFITMKKLAGNKIPDMISLDKSIFLGGVNGEEFKVGRSLAKKIVLEISGSK